MTFRSLVPALVVGVVALGIGAALAVGTIVIPPQRSLGATTLYDETLNPPAPIGIAGAPLHFQLDGPGPAGNNGTDRSFNASSLAGLTLIGTIAAYSARIELDLVIGCPEGASIVLDDQAGASTSTIISVFGPVMFDSGNGARWITHSHAGRVRVYSSNATCQVSGREW